jgi:uncharacterized protein
MNSEERQLIANLFERLRTLDSTAKDPEADQFIRDLIRQFPDAPYFLVQSVLVQEQALRNADARIRALEEAARGEGDRPRSFLGGARSGDTGSRPLSSSEPSDEGPWSRSSRPQATPQGDSRPGGFLSSALSTATGVAGGMFLADSIRSLFGGVGGRSYFGSGDTAIKTDQAALDRAQDEAQDAEDDAQKARDDLAADDAALDDMQDAEDDDGDWSDDGGIDT